MLAKILVLSGLLAASLAAESHYQITAQVLPETSELRAEAAFTFPVPAGSREVKFALNKGLHVTSAGCSRCEGYSFDATRGGGFMYVPHGAPLVFHFRKPLARAENVRFQVKYEGQIVSSRENGIHSDWVELALYSAWFPFPADHRRFTYDVRLSLDPTYRVAAAGVVKAVKPGVWEIRQSQETFDIVLMASRRLETHTVEGAELTLASVGLDEKTAAHIAQEAVAAIHTLSGWFGPSDSGRLTVVFTPRHQGGGYSRPGLVCYDQRILGSESNLIAGLAHEIAHLWWIGAPVTTWEDWLNEGFAEYVSVMVIRERLGDEAARARLALYEKDAKGTPPIWGIPRESSQAYAVLYEKGALVLSHLEIGLGTEKFHRFLAALLKAKVRSVAEALQILEQMASPQSRQNLERLLRE